MCADVSRGSAVAPNAYPIGQLLFVVIDEDIGAKGTPDPSHLSPYCFDAYSSMFGDGLSHLA